MLNALWQNAYSKIDEAGREMIANENGEVEEDSDGLEFNANEEIQVQVPNRVVEASGFISLRGSKKHSMEERSPKGRLCNVDCPLR
jgi:hypothetical protein